MNKNVNGTELSLEPLGGSLAPRAIVCPKCQHKRTANDSGPEWQCPNCGIAYNKAAPPSADVTHRVSGTSGARGRREVDRDEFDTATPRALSLSLSGRIGRLRYLAYWWPTVLLSAFLMLLAIRPGTVGKASTIFLVILLCVLWMCMSLRLMALRMHDLNQSSKWLLALIFLPGVLFAFGKPQLAAMCSSLFWIGGLMLMLVPGTDGDNTFGPPPAANTTWVKAGAGFTLLFMVLGVIGNIKYVQYIRSGKLNSPLASAQADSGSSTPDAAAALRRAAENPYPDWVGSWQGLHTSLQVDNLGMAAFSHIDGAFSVRVSGPLKVDENSISIGYGADAKVLKLAVPPHMEGQTARMMLDGVELVRR